MARLQAIRDAVVIERRPFLCALLATLASLSHRLLVPPLGNLLADVPLRIAPPEPFTEPLAPVDPPVEFSMPVVPPCGLSLPTCAHDAEANATVIPRTKALVPSSLFILRSFLFVAPIERCPRCSVPTAQTCE